MCARARVCLKIMEKGALVHSTCSVFMDGGEGRGCGFRGDEREVSVSRGGQKPKPLLLSSRFVPPPVSHCWAS